ncbi:MFS transporter (plasmid) [Paraburkholderia largidicola]|uniref:MFS transporter n=2 Tax=Burkholderiaceae TaxID=119060 RepID=A0A7I8C0R4_9BURK|nr:MFS transporter [Paraburkholderia sp. PGU16]
MQTIANEEQETTMLNRREARMVGLAALGAMLEFYDFVVYLFVATALGDAFFPPDVSPWTRQIETFAIFAIGYLVRPVAGIVMAHFGDTVGRKKMFIFLIILMAVPTFLIGVLPTYEQAGMLAPIMLLTLRALQGCAVGGELPGAAVFAAEHASPTRLGATSGTLHGVVHLGLVLGTGAAALAAIIAAKLDMPSLAWRLPFLAGGVFGLAAAWLRRHLEESPLYAQMRQVERKPAATPLKAVLTDHAGACLFGLSLMFVMAVLVTLFFQFVPAMIVTAWQVPRQDVLHANIWGTLALAVSMPLWGRVSDRLGWARMLAIGAVLNLLAAIWFFHMLPGVVAAHDALAPLFCVEGAAVASIIAQVPGLTASLFPTSVRQSGYAVPYNVGAALFAGLCPVVLSWLVREFGLSAPLYPVIVAVIVSGCLAIGLPRVRLYLGSGALRMMPVSTETTLPDYKKEM